MKKTSLLLFFALLVSLSVLSAVAAAVEVTLERSGLEPIICSSVRVIEDDVICKNGETTSSFKIAEITGVEMIDNGETLHFDGINRSSVRAINRLAGAAGDNVTAGAAAVTAAAGSAAASAVTATAAAVDSAASSAGKIVPARPVPEATAASYTIGGKTVTVPANPGELIAAKFAEIDFSSPAGIGILVLTFLGLLFTLAGALWWLFATFSKGILWGLACLLIPFVGLVFLFVHWDAAWKPFMLSLLGIICFVAIGLLLPDVDPAMALSL